MGMLAVCAWVTCGLTLEEQAIHLSNARLAGRTKWYLDKKPRIYDEKQINQRINTVNELLVARYTYKQSETCGTSQATVTNCTNRYSIIVNWKAVSPGAVPDPDDIPDQLSGAHL